ncbi:hypothetical protein [Streptomyces anandii]|uniref:Uncharacterized protein n=1 Tax=Streptomyces anandii TaxID=285454 RepID=A0ABW6H608_9ACTN
MRTPNDQEYANLLAMSDSRRLFVARWTELFDAQISFRFRHRPITRELLGREQNAITLNRQGSQVLDRSVLYAQLVNEETQQLPQVMFKRWSAGFVESSPMDAAERIAGGFALAGHSNELLFQARRHLLNGGDLQEQLDDAVRWHSERSYRRPFLVVVPAAQKGFVPASSGMSLVPAGQEDGQGLLPPALVAEYRRALQRGHVEPTDVFVRAVIETQDANRAWELFRELFDRYLTRLRPSLRPVPLREGTSVFVWDPHPGPDGRAIGFKPKSPFPYPAPPFPSGPRMTTIVDLASSDPVLDVVLDQYTSALHALKADDTRRAFILLIPLLDIAFQCGTGRQRAKPPFARAIEAGALLLALSEPKAHFDHLVQFLRRKSWITGRPALVAKDHEALAILTNEQKWSAICRTYDWNPLVHVRRTHLMAMLRGNMRHPRLRRRTARWDLARAIRARHAYAHRGEPLTDTHLLAVLLETVHQCLAARCVAAETGMEFGALIDLMEDVVTGTRTLPDWPSLALDGLWSLPPYLR